MRSSRWLFVVPLALATVVFVAATPASAAAVESTAVLEAADLEPLTVHMRPGGDLPGASLLTPAPASADLAVSAAEICLPQEPDCTVEEFNVNIAYLAEVATGITLVAALITLNPLLIAPAIIAVDIATLNLFSAELALELCERGNNET